MGNVKNILEEANYNVISAKVGKRTIQRKEIRQDRAIVKEKVDNVFVTIQKDVPKVTDNKGREVENKAVISATDKLKNIITKILVSIDKLATAGEASKIEKVVTFLGKLSGTIKFEDGGSVGSYERGKNYPVKTIPASDCDKYGLSEFPNFSRTGSIIGMKQKYYGKDALLVKCGNYIYNVTSEPDIYFRNAYEDGGSVGGEFNIGDLVYAPDYSLVGLVISNIHVGESDKKVYDVLFRGMSGGEMEMEPSEMIDITDGYMEFAENKGDLMHYPNIAKKHGIKINEKYFDDDFENGGCLKKKANSGLDKVDSVTVDVPLFIRMLEYSREDAKTDMDLHVVTENAINISKSKGVLTMEDYDGIVGEKKFEKGGVIVTSIKDIPDFKEELEAGRVTYRGMGLGKLQKEFENASGTSGTIIKVKGKEYFITDDEFNTFSRDEKGDMRIRFSAPSRKHEGGGDIGYPAINYLGDLWFAVFNGESEKYEKLAKNLDELNISFRLQNDVSADAQEEKERGKKAIDTAEVADRIKKIIEKHDEDVRKDRLDKLKEDGRLHRFVDIDGSGNKVSETIIPDKDEVGCYNRYISGSKGSLGEWRNRLSEDELLNHLRKTSPKFEDGGDVDSSNEEKERLKFNYMMLSRLQSDCDYYLGYGNRSEKNLWADDVDKHIAEMKRLWNGFPEDKKPEWLSMDEILEYEKKMKEEFSNGGGVSEPETRRFRYLDITFYPNRIKLTLNEDGHEFAEENGLTWENFDQLFDDIQGNSELMYVENAGQVGLGITDAPAITDGYYYGDEGEMVPNIDAAVYYDNDYMLRDFAEVLKDEGEVEFLKA